jgi:uncharacterized protein DUF6584
MARTETLERVERDLAAGHTHVAVQRLSSLLRNDPADLRLRDELASVHLRTGNLVEAGRWSYLSETADAAAVRAFERAIPDPRVRLTALRWPEQVTAPARLQMLEEECARLPRQLWRPPEPVTRGERIAEAASVTTFLVFLCALAAVWVVGAVAVARWVF